MKKSETIPQTFRNTQTFHVPAVRDIIVRKKKVRRKILCTKEKKNHGKLEHFQN